MSNENEMEENDMTTATESIEAPKVKRGVLQGLKAIQENKSPKADRRQIQLNLGLENTARVYEVAEENGVSVQDLIRVALFDAGLILEPKVR